MRSLGRALGRVGVVLSLVALVFSACSDGGGDDSGEVRASRGKEVLSISVVTPPENYSIEGLPVNLYGMRVEVHYKDTTSEVIEITDFNDFKGFYTLPAAAARYGVLTPEGSRKDAIAAGELKKSYIMSSGTVVEQGDMYWNTAVNSTVRSEVWSMGIPDDYRYAEYRVVDYILAYNPGGLQSAATTPLRIWGVLDIKYVDVGPAGYKAPKDEYFIDDSVVFAPNSILLYYDTATGYFVDRFTGQGVNGDEAGNEKFAVWPYEEDLDWSLNPPSKRGAKPFLRVNAGNRLAKPNDVRSQPEKAYNAGERYNRRDINFEKLYLVDRLEVDKATEPSQAEMEFYNNDEWTMVTNRLEWLNRLRKVEVIVHYKEALGENVLGDDAPYVKRIVENPKRNDRELAMAAHFTGNGRGWMYRPANTLGSGTYNFEGTIVANSGIQAGGVPWAQWNNNKDILRESYSAGPVIRGSEDQVRGNPPSDTYYNVVFTHQNAERYGRINVDPDRVRHTTLTYPVKVFLLQEDSLVVENTTVRFPLSPPDQRGTYWDFIDKLGSITATWRYAARDTEGEEIASSVETRTTEHRIDPRDTRLVVTGSSRGYVMVDNTMWTDNIGQGMKQVGFWRTASNGEDPGVQYPLNYTVDNVNAGPIDITLILE